MSTAAAQLDPVVVDVETAEFKHYEIASPH
jgi:hypothetical protein